MRWMLVGLAAVSAQAQAADEPYYGPMKHWRGIGFEQGHKETVEKDGSWRVTGATVRGGDAVDIAMYRAAELARAQGFAYVQLLGGSGSRGPGHQSATLYALPSHSPAPPTACRSKRPGTCYTADVGDLLRIWAEQTAGTPACRSSIISTAMAGRSAIRGSAWAMPRRGRPFRGRPRRCKPAPCRLPAHRCRRVPCRQVTRRESSRRPRCLARATTVRWRRNAASTGASRNKAGR